ncbi:DUF1800 domain-containing protein [Aquabacterium sp. OR-4]|uniref:DUF1800 domain-containing protein n=1 Tax=Aquabacterium sp. OR-4 TaxID=2978127 RepID=UPI0028C65049|nr:DUF1800 domain-containing protein [Aquabacterium sp. OR-4]MDT7838791.1 DUF1800 domain-containing protein [Aquabacterium sp. OR-4]
MHAAALAAHRFGYAETSLRALQADPQAWVLAQFSADSAAANAFDTRGLADAAAALRISREVLRTALQPQPAGSAAASGQGSAASADPARREARQALRQLNLDGLQRRWQHTVRTEAPVAERWAQFWSNHFCVAATKGSTLGLVWPHEHEAIRPQAQGRFVDLLKASTLHPAMLLYLDNAQSMGPDSRAGQRRQRGLNENLARELLELHTLGVGAGYTQADVTETARLLTGWTVRYGSDGQAVFQATLHQPGPKTVLGRRYDEGPQALDALLLELSRHPATAQHLATKLARHFVTDAPPPALVAAVAAAFRASDGDLRATALALFTHPQTWRPDHPPKFKRPDELLLSAHRMLKLPFGDAQLQAGVQAVQAMGQSLGRAPSPQGWPDRSEDWLSPDALFKRVQWAERFAASHANQADARRLAPLSLGDDLSAATQQQIDRAESGAQALALWLASPEFQRR